jgi:hypothetical protein
LLGFFNDDRDLVTHGHVKESLSETRRPDFISTFVFTVSPDLPQPTHRLEEEDTLRGILFLRLKSSHFFFEGLPVGEYLLGDPMLWGDDSNSNIGDRSLIPHKGKLNKAIKLWDEGIFNN